MRSTWWHAPAYWAIFVLITAPLAGTVWLWGWAVLHVPAMIIHGLHAPLAILAAAFVFGVILVSIVPIVALIIGVLRHAPLLLCRERRGVMTVYPIGEAHVLLARSRP